MDSKTLQEEKEKLEKILSTEKATSKEYKTARCSLTGLEYLENLLAQRERLTEKLRGMRENSESKRLTQHHLAGVEKEIVKVSPAPLTDDPPPAS